ncbi:MAG: RsmD family RNA methyltransferase [Chitinophagaceae bacterium]
MRIISGSLGGRKVSPPAKMPYTRPTTDIAKEGLFNIIQNNIEIEGIKTLDLFGGTGSISYELGSRGATDQTIVEKDPTMHAFIKKTAAELGLKHLDVVKSEVFKFMDLCQEQYDLIFAGPPYALETIDMLPVKVVEKKLLKPNGWFILEHTPRNNYEGYPLFVQERNYGTTVFSFFINR